METAPAARRITWLAYTAVFLSGLNGGWLGPLLPEISRVQGIPLDRLGLLASVSFVGFMLTVTVAGALVERWGGRVALTLSTGLLAVGLLGLAGLPGLAGLLAGALVAGLGTGINDVASHVVIVALNDEERVTAELNYLNVAFSVGALLGPLLVGAALHFGVPYSAVFGGGAVLAALTALLVATTHLSHDRPAHAEGTPARALLARPALWVLGGSLGLYVGAEVALGTWVPSYLHRVDGLSESLAAWGVSLFWIGLALGRLASGRLAARVATRPLTLGAMALSLVALAALTPAPAGAALHAALVFVIGLGFGPVFPNAIATGAALFPRQVGAMTSHVITLGSLGGIVLPWLMGRLLVRAGPQPAMLLVCAAAAGMLALFWALRATSGERGAGG
ncbi:MAG TPA: MFS transporter [Thermomicrobiales bacterium]|nr:MFS transporter [Thermomicrobiales bacterium]